MREAALRLAEPRLDGQPTVTTKALSLAEDPDPMVRFQLALSLGEVKGDQPECEQRAGCNRRA